MQHELKKVAVKGCEQYVARNCKVLHALVYSTCSNFYSTEIIVRSTRIHEISYGSASNSEINGKACLLLQAIMKVVLQVVRGQITCEALALCDGGFRSKVHSSPVALIQKTPRNEFC